MQIKMKITPIILYSKKLNKQQSIILSTETYSNGSVRVEFECLAIEIVAKCSIEH